MVNHEGELHEWRTDNAWLTKAQADATKGHGLVVEELLEKALANVKCMKDFTGILDPAQVNLLNTLSYDLVLKAKAELEQFGLLP